MKFQKGHKINLGRKCSEITKKKISKSEKGKIVSEKTKMKMRKRMKGNKLCIGRIPWNKGLKGSYNLNKNKGKNHWQWKGGISKKRHIGKKYEEWRMKVFLRDNFACQFCGIKGVYLEAHHIKSWIKYLKLRFDIDNGITLCQKCHKLAHQIFGKPKCYGKNN